MEDWYCEIGDGSLVKPANLVSELCLSRHTLAHSSGMNSPVSKILNKLMNFPNSIVPRSPLFFYLPFAFTIIEVTYIIKTLHICILKLAPPSWSRALYMAVYGGFHQKQTGLTDKQ